MHKVRGDPDKKLLMLIAAVFTALMMFGSHSVFASELGTDPLAEETAVVETIPEETATEPAPVITEVIEPAPEEALPPEEIAVEATPPVTETTELPPEEALPPEEVVAAPEETALEPIPPIVETTEPPLEEALPPEEITAAPEETAIEPTSPAAETEPLPEEALPPLEEALPPIEEALPSLEEAVTEIIAPEAQLPATELAEPLPEILTEAVTDPEAPVDEALPADKGEEILAETVSAPEGGAGLEAVTNEEAPLPELVDPEGYVYDAMTKLPIENATVTVYRTTDGGVNYTLYDNTLNGTMVNPQATNVEGYYSYMVEAGFYKIVAGKEGYAESSMKFEQILLPEILFIHRIDFYLLPYTSGWISFDGDVTITEDILLSGEDLVISSADTD
ncbi:MAG: hypothetical protein K0M69_07460, partial [Youngiibacter sp.]|nr:hypothetical protein [Youngiibacter sp.]